MQWWYTSVVCNLTVRGALRLMLTKQGQILPAHNLGRDRLYSTVAVLGSSGLLLSFRHLRHKNDTAGNKLCSQILYYTTTYTIDSFITTVPYHVRVSNKSEVLLPKSFVPCVQSYFVSLGT